ncbi:hypothetical protein STRIP9103_02550 [Streptomyces ipomoeae 91-03]|uniref:Uncharacterized protein n=1 Tax=Streptomyces ipomoeae 91-03 TaxID=698759 RepID=L1KIB3_9ACTN|nr:hypothetical protein STRIP9103_02550 [Streptomyces ipomoeae 91-03]
MATATALALMRPLLALEPASPPVGAAARLWIVDGTLVPVRDRKVGARVWRNSALPDRCQGVTVLGDGAYINTGLVVPHRKRPGRPLLAGEEADNAKHCRVSGADAPCGGSGLAW